MRRGFHVTEAHKLEDIEVTVFGERIARCRCGWRSGRWSTPRLATDEHRAHQSSQPRLTPAERQRRWRTTSPGRVPPAVSGESASPVVDSPQSRRK